MEEPETDVTLDKPAPKVKCNTTARKVVGIIFAVIGALGVIFFTLRTLHYVSLSHATDEVRQKNIIRFV